MSRDREDIVSASFGPAEILDSNISLSFATISLLICHSLGVHPKYPWSRNVGSPRSTSSMRIFQVGSMFSVLPASLISSTGERINIPNSELFPNRVQIEFSQIAFPIIVLPQGDRTDSYQEERLGLPYWTIILATCASVDVSKYLDIPIWEFSIILQHLSFFLCFS